jgi:hypothetical protein
MVASWRAWLIRIAWLVGLPAVAIAAYFGAAFTGARIPLNAARSCGRSSGSADR